MTYGYLGATPEDWYHFDFVLGLGANLLPCVPASPTVAVVPGSALEGKVGKIPSQFNAEGLAHGLKEWQKRTILGNEVKLWSADRRLNLCVRTGPVSGVYAFDVDVDDVIVAGEIYALIEKLVGHEQPIRTRENSAKFLLPFYMEQPCKKRKIKLDKSPKGPAIELLADGQQFVASGSHSSGVRYRWLPELPTHMPVLTLDQVNQLWTELTSRYATDSIQAPPSKTSGSALTPSSMLLATGLRSTTDMATAGSYGTEVNSSHILSEISEPDWQQLRAALRHMLDKVGDNDTWSQVGYALLSIQHTRPAEQLWYDFSARAVGYEDGAPEAWWQAHARQTPRSDYRHIFTMARQRGWGAASSPEVFKPVEARPERNSEVCSLTGDDPADEGSDGPKPADGAAVESDLITNDPIKPIIRIVDKNFSQNIHQLEAALANAQIYKQKQWLVHVEGGVDANSIERSKDQKMLLPVNKAYALTLLGEIVQWQRYSKKDEGFIDTGPDVQRVNTVVEKGEWPNILALDALVRAPFIRPDGSICDTPGYDRASRALLIPSAEFPPIPQDPSHADAVAALGRIRRVFHQFPWATPAAESGFLAHVLSEVGRLAFNRCPMYFYNAPTAGTGKTLLQKAAAIIAHGSIPALRPWVGDGNEIRKTIFASLRAGDRSLLFDNVPDGIKVRSSELCMAITSDDFQDRILGESESKAVPNRAVFSASGNNVNPAGDLSRRSIVIRLDANTERLTQRVFDIEDLESYLVRERANLLVDVLTIISAYTRTPTAELVMPVPLPSFEQWSRLVREPLIWLGLPDPVDTQKSDANEDQDNLAAAFDLLVARFGRGEFASVDIARSAGGISDANGQLTNALISCGCKEPNSPQDVGRWLRRNNGKVFGGMKLVGGAHGMSGTKWSFLKVE